MSEEHIGLQLDEEVDLAMAFLLGFAVPRHHLSQFLLTAWKTSKPLLGYWGNAHSLWDTVIDLHPSVDRFKAQIQVLGEQGEQFPCVVRDRRIPLPIDPIALPDFNISLLGTEFTTEIEIPKLDVKNLSIERFPVEQTTGFFIGRLTNFLRTRLSARTASMDRGYTFLGGSTPGLTFRVTTLTPGLRVHYTHQYYLSPNYVFGAPTTPVDGYIKPGRWHFGTSQGNSPVTFDLNTVYDVPSVSQAHLQV